MAKNAIDHLWDKDAAELTNEDVDEIIAYQIKMLTAYESGVKPKRDVEEAIDWTEVVANIAGKAPAAAPKKAKFKRRI